MKQFVLLEVIYHIYRTTYLGLRDRDKRQFGGGVLEILQRDDLKRGGFAGLRETRLVMDQRIFGGGTQSGAWDGVGGFVYLADARFLPKGETRLHGHKEIDVISVMVGRPTQP